MSRLHRDAGQVAFVMTNTYVNTLVDVIRLISIGIACFTINYKRAIVVLCSFSIYVLFAE